MLPINEKNTTWLNHLKLKFSLQQKEQTEITIPLSNNQIISSLSKNKNLKFISKILIKDVFLNRTLPYKIRIRFKYHKKNLSELLILESKSNMQLLPSYQLKTKKLNVYKICLTNNHNIQTKLLSSITEQKQYQITKIRTTLQSHINNTPIFFDFDALEQVITFSKHLPSISIPNYCLDIETSSQFDIKQLLNYLKKIDIHL